MTTPAALTPALAAWLATSSSEAAATLAIAATSSRRPISPTLIESCSTSSGREDPSYSQQKSGAQWGAPDHFNSTLQRFDQPVAARGARLRELRWKNSAWLATAETIAGWNGFEIRNAGSGRSPVRKRSGYAVMNTTGTSNTFNSSLTASRPDEPSASWMSARIRPGFLFLASATASAWVR